MARRASEFDLFSAGDHDSFVSLVTQTESCRDPTGAKNLSAARDLYGKNGSGGQSSGVDLGLPYRFLNFDSRGASHASPRISLCLTLYLPLRPV